MKIVELNSNQTEHPFGTYVYLQMAESSANQLDGWLTDHNIDHVDKSDFHLTICYSRNPVPQLKSLTGIITISAHPYKWSIFGPDDGNSLVINVECPKAVKLQTYCIEQGATCDFPTYQPHVSVFKTDKISKRLPDQIPQFDLIFDQIIVKPMKEK